MSSSNAGNLQPRYQWAAIRISQALGLDISLVESFFRGANLARFNELLSSDQDAPKRIYVYYQQILEQDEDGELVESKNEPELFFGSGEEQQRLEGKCCYFIRSGDVASEVDVTKANGPDLLFGIIEANPLLGFGNSLSKLYAPMLGTQQSIWGRADPEHTKEFRQEVDKMASSLQEALRSLVDGLELKKPDKRYEPDSRGLVARGMNDKEMLRHFEELLQSWCDDIEMYVGAKDEDENMEAGPMAELDYWRQRMQRLNSITEQIKSKECKMVINVLSSLTKSPQVRRKVPTFILSKVWTPHTL